MNNGYAQAFLSNRRTQPNAAAFVAIANAAEAKAEPILRNMSEAKAGLERAMNVF